MNDPASNHQPARVRREVEAVETIGGVLADLVELAEELPVQLGHAEPAARILDRLSEELAEAAGMLRDQAGLLPADAGLTRLRAAFPGWLIAWVGGPDWRGYTASRESFPPVCAATAPVLAARIIDREAGTR